MAGRWIHTPWAACTWLAVAAVATFLTGRPAAAELAGTPTVIDGDTIELNGRLLHLGDIDAPELGQHCIIKGQTYDCGMVSRTALLDLTAGTPVVCTLLPAARTDVAAAAEATEGVPARCSAGGYDLSEGMAYTGWALVEQPRSPRAKVYAERAENARRARRGLWRGRFVAPWAWRAGERLPPGNPER